MILVDPKQGKAKLVPLVEHSETVVKSILVKISKVIRRESDLPLMWFVLASFLFCMKEGRVVARCDVSADIEKEKRIRTFSIHSYY